MFLFLLLGLCAASGGLNVTLVCQNAADLYGLLYNVCNPCLLCRRLYQIGSGDPDDARKFQFQVSLLEFFLATGGQDLSWPHRHRAGKTLRFIEHIWPPEWRPTIEVEFASNATSCASGFSLTDPANLPLIYVLLDMMKTYRAYIAVEAFCGENERMLFDPRTERFYCLCVPGKSCSGNEGNLDTMVPILLYLFLGLILFIAVAVVLIGILFFRLKPGENAVKGTA